MSDEDGRWLPVPVEMLTPRHALHPKRTGDEAGDLVAFLDLAAQARWQDGQTLDRGELAASRRFLARRWNWSKSKVGRFLKRLEDEGEIERLGTVDPPEHLAGHLAGQQATHLKVCDYSRFEVFRDTYRDTNRDKEQQGSYTAGDEDTPESAETAFVEEAWEVYLEELGGSGRQPTLTPKRERKIAALYREQLSESASPLADFRAVLREVKASDHHMSKRSYQMPESLFRNAERRERWTLEALDGDGRQVEQIDLDRQRAALDVLDGGMST